MATAIGSGAGHAPTRRLAGLQYLRAMAAIAVVVLHAGRTGWDFHAGEAGVDLFFVLSGFLMVVITGAGTRPAAFLADRLRRIAPVYWIATSVVLAGALGGAFPRLRLDPAHVAASYLFVPWRSPSDGHPWPLLVPGWTLNFEMFFYLLFAALLPLASQARRVAILTALLSALVAAGLLGVRWGAALETYTDPMMLEFAAGCWLGILWKRPGAWPRAFGGGTAAAGGAAILVGAAIVPTSWRALTYGVPAALIVASVLAMERRGAVAERRLPLFLGDASYSIYIWHTLAVSVVLAVCARLGVPSLAATVAGVAGGVAAGLIGYVAIERPVLAWFRARRTVRGVTVPAGP